MLIIIVVSEVKSMMMLQDKNQHSKNAHNCHDFLKDFDDMKGRKEATHFLILSMAAATARF